MPEGLKMGRIPREEVYKCPIFEHFLSVGNPKAETRAEIVSIELGPRRNKRRNNKGKGRNANQGNKNGNQGNKNSAMKKEKQMPAAGKKS